jgi:hypothetical protein
LTDFEPLDSTRFEGVASFVESRYPLAPPLRCRMLSRGFNDIFSVVAATGERFVFRLSHHRARGHADVRTETAFLIHLATVGTPVAPPVATRSGATATGRSSRYAPPISKQRRFFVIARHIWTMGEKASRAHEWGSDNVAWIARAAEFLRRREDERLRDRLFGGGRLTPAPGSPAIPASRPCRARP